MIQSTLDALCDPTRRSILRLLMRGERSAGEICEKFDISTPAISRHLAVLCDAELVRAERRGKRIFYSLRCEPVEALRAWADEFLASAEEY